MPLDIFPGEWQNSQVNKEDFYEPIDIGDRVEVIIDSQFQDKYSDNTELPRRIGEIGIVMELDCGDEWGYKVKFSDGETNWFKRYLLHK